MKTGNRSSLPLRRIDSGAETQVYAVKRTNPQRISAERTIVVKDINKKDGFNNGERMRLEEQYRRLKELYGEFIPPMKFIKSPTSAENFLMIQSRIEGEYAFQPTLVTDPEQQNALRRFVETVLDQLYSIINATLDSRAGVPDAVVPDLHARSNLLEEKSTGRFFYVDSGYESAEVFYDAYKREGIRGLMLPFERLFYLMIRSGKPLEEMPPTGDFYGVYDEYPEIEDWKDLPQKEVLQKLHAKFHL